MASTVEARIYDCDGNWGTRGFRKASLASPVSAFHFVAHANVDNLGGDGQPPTNHWTLLLQTDTHAAVRLDMSPGDIGRPGMLILEDVKDTSASPADASFPDDRIHVVSVPVISESETTVEHILALIVREGRDNYIFAPVGEGCRFWLYTFAHDLGVEDIISFEDAERVHTALPKYYLYPPGTPAVQRPMAEGRFF
ncbi:hypothetical protein BD626DRAFT_493419 [Schizophyllum amplum]|uniref:DUF7770 domain-containing protein n=1 Tax=Schizophyllum amplum TaxID=97359 RepID=A0A550CGQ2_9AGAR|nr:hypothetical protein BD626DRAFT_493419 [Auriculariopsis ampla]